MTAARRGVSAAPGAALPAVPHRALAMALAVNLAIVVAASLTASMLGCGTPGAPQPPSLKLPVAVANLGAARTGDRVLLTWTMPRRTTDRLMLKANVTVRVCHREAGGECETAADALSFAPGAAGSYTDTLPAALAASAPRALTYFIELKSKSGRSAGLSNGATVLAGASPQAVTGLRADAHKEGVELHWTATNGADAVRLRRTLVSAAKPTHDERNRDETNPLAVEKEPAEQNLLVDNGASAGGAIDRTALAGETYEYRAQRVARVSASSQALELDGELSAPVRVVVEDVFPPAVPTGLVAVATAPEPTAPGQTAPAQGTAAGPAIDLSWQPVADADLAGYIVYRREGSAEWARISAAQPPNQPPNQPVVGPAFHDANVIAGHTYQYAVSAIGKNGHESARSAPAEETVPN